LNLLSSLPEDKLFIILKAIKCRKIMVGVH
jgi:hypothetical protein